MVAHQIDGRQTGDGRSAGQQGNHAGTVGTEIDVIAKMQQYRGRRRTSHKIVGDRFVQLTKLDQAAVNVADRVDPSAARQPARRQHEVQRCGIGGCDTRRTPGWHSGGIEIRADTGPREAANRASHGAHYAASRCARAMLRVRLRAQSRSDRRKPLAKITFPVEAGHIMLFARAIGDTNPVFQDAEAAMQTEVGGIIAPPTFPQAVAQFDPDYPLRWRPGKPWFGSGKTASGVESNPSGGGGLHAEQHFEYHRPLRPGDVLTVETKPGNTWERESRRAGKLTFRERITEYRDQKGELVVTARSVGVTTERPVERS